MSEDHRPATASEGDESFVLDELGRADADPALDADPTATARAETMSRDAVEAAIVDDVVEHFEDDYDPAALGIDAPDPASVRRRWFDFGYLDDCEVVSWRWSRRPYSYTAIVYDPAENERRYRAEAPVLTEFEQYVREDLTRILRQDLMHRDVGAEEERDEIFELEVQRVFDEHAAAVPPATLLRVLYYLRRDFVRYGKIDPLMGDPAIEDISCDGVGVPLFVYHGDYRDLETNLSFSEERLGRLVGHRHLVEDVGIVFGRLGGVYKQSRPSASGLAPEAVHRNRPLGNPHWLFECGHRRSSASTSPSSFRRRSAIEASASSNCWSDTVGISRSRRESIGGAGGGCRAGSTNAVSSVFRYPWTLDRAWPTAISLGRSRSATPNSRSVSASSKMAMFVTGACAVCGA
ncbi:hypothetical protein [Halosimplex rubrum]|uniref:hypothetical protein n=1 Tax=Halosimplex rubrum TaxID=869889 RepID=UPI001FE9E305|nr:hypothetical protein [Halosimplex rubrum]